MRMRNRLRPFFAGGKIDSSVRPMAGSNYLKYDFLFTSDRDKKCEATPFSVRRLPVLREL